MLVGKDRKLPWNRSRPHRVFAAADLSRKVPKFPLGLIQQAELCRKVCRNPSPAFTAGQRSTHPGRLS